jgi:Tfp pilus assembly protein PilO
MKGSTRILLAVIVAVVIAGAAGFLVVLPLSRQTNTDRAAIDERRAQLVKLQRVARRISDLQQEVKRLEGALAFFENRLPQEREIDVILREVWLTAEAQSLTTRSIRTTVSQSMPRYNYQPITLVLEGPFEGFYEFLLGLERLPRITKIRQMQITKSPLQEGTVQVELLMDIYFETPK